MLPGSGERGAAGGGAEVAAVGGEAELGDSGAAGAGPDLDDAGHGVGAVERALRAADEFEAIDFGERDGAEVGGLAGGVDGDAIDDEFVVGGFAAADEERGDAAALAGGR